MTPSYSSPKSTVQSSWPTNIGELNPSSVPRSRGPYGFPGSGLGARHDVPAGRYDGNAMLLHRGGLGVARLGNVVLQRLAETRLLKRLQVDKPRSWHADSSPGHKNRLKVLLLYHQV